MRKLIFALLLLLLLSGPLWAAVSVTCLKNGNMVTVSYNGTTEPNLVRAYALDITVDSGAVIKENPTVCGLPKDWSEYTIYPGSIDINDDTGLIDSLGTIVGDPCDAPLDTKAGYGTSGITIEAGSLYAPATGRASPNFPPDSGTLFKFWVCQDTNVTITTNATRGGIVLEDGTTPVTTNLPYTVFIEMTDDPVWGVCARPMGDLSGDNRIRTTDITNLVSRLSKYATFRIYDHWNDGNWEPCGDMDSNGRLMTTDITKIVSMLSPCTGFRILSPPCP